MPSSITTTSTPASSPNTVPATPMAPTPSNSTADSNPAPGLPPSSLNHTCTDKWVINLSKTPLPRNNYPYSKKDQTTPSPQIPPIEAYITATEQASSRLPAEEADEFRLEVNKILKQQQQHHNNQCNLNPSQCRALTQLRQDNSRVVLTADKGVSMVIMDQEDYTNKDLGLLQDTNTYKVLPKDPTSHLSTTNTNSYTPPVQFPSNSMAWPKSIKQVHPLGTLFQVRGSITYGIAKELAHIIKPLVGQSPHHLKNTQHFIQQLQGKKLEPGEVITSFDVKALFTSVPVKPAIQIVKQRLQQDNTLPQRTSMSIAQITSLLEFCLTNTYFLFQGKYYEQVQGAAMGSPISPLIANIFMEEFEVKALSSIPHPSSLWLRFVDDTFVINRAEHSQDLLHHINNQNPHIQVTVEPTQQGSLPFLDTLVTIEPDNTFSTTVYRKPTHTDQ